MVRPNIIPRKWCIPFLLYGNGKLQILFHLKLCSPFCIIYSLQTKGHFGPRTLFLWGLNRVSFSWDFTTSLGILWIKFFSTKKIFHLFFLKKCKQTAESAGFFSEMSSNFAMIFSQENIIFGTKWAKIKLSTFLSQFDAVLSHI